MLAHPDPDVRNQSLTCGTGNLQREDPGAAARSRRSMMAAFRPCPEGLSPLLAARPGLRPWCYGAIRPAREAAASPVGRAA
jgi:hypothetical protein